MEKVIQVGDTEVKFKATASTARRYRERFGSDIFVDINKLVPSLSSGTLEAGTLEVFENIAYTMAKQADESIPDDPDEWLDGFEMLPFFQVLPQIVELWSQNTMTLEKPKKKVNRQSGH